MSIDADHLATRLGETVSSTTGADAMGRLSDTEYDETGAVLGHGITLRETPHRFTVDGQALYT